MLSWTLDSAWHTNPAEAAAARAVTATGIRIQRRPIPPGGKKPSIHVEPVFAGPSRAGGQRTPGVRSSVAKKCNLVSTARGVWVIGKSRRNDAGRTRLRWCIRGQLGSAFHRPQGNLELMSARDS